MKQHKNYVDNLHLHQETFHQNLTCSRRLILLNLKLNKLKKTLHLHIFD